MSDNIIDVIKYVKRFTTVPEKFIDELFKFYTNHTTQVDPVISLDDITTWLGGTKSELHRTLKRSYILNVDYTSVKKVIPLDSTRRKKYNNNYTQVLITPDCFKRLCMMSRTKKAEMVRSYFIDVETQFFRYKDQLMEGLRHDLNPKRALRKVKSTMDGFIYIIFASTEVETLYKIGRAKDLKSRLFTYQTGRAHEVIPLYILEVHDMKSAERCIKAHLQEYQYRKRREVYQIPLDLLKNVINKCNGIDAVKKHYVRRAALPEQNGGKDGSYYAVFSKDLILP